MQAKDRDAVHTREPQLAFSDPKPHDISELLAAIYKIGQHDHCSQTYSKPLNRPTQRPRTLTEVLDSLASLGVSKPKNEAIATGLRVDDRNKSVELIIAGNSDVSLCTSIHLIDMWKFMKQLPDRFYEINPSRTESLQSRPSDQEFRIIYNEFAKSCFGFSFERIRAKVNGKLGKFNGIDTSGLSSNHPFHNLKDRINDFHCSYTREHQPMCGKPSRQDNDFWVLFHMCLRDIKRKTKSLYENGGFQDDKIRALGCSGLDRYLRKINSFVHGFEVLVNAAMSPRCRRLFAYQATVRSLPKWTTKLDHVVNTAEDWERVLEKAVVYTNSRPRHEDGKDESHVMDMAVISEDTALMAREDITDTLVVHCEVKLLLALQKSHDEQKSIPRAHPYIGGSKLSCNGCDCFFRAFNNTHRTNWKTRGTHGKSYYPWTFPCTFPEQDVVGRFTYSIIAERWVQLYRGYRVHRNKLDSIDQPSRTDERVPSLGEKRES